jgi:two-component system, LytTR family, response regulator
MKLSIAIIDDEKHAIETLSYDLMENHSDDMEIVFSTANPVEGVKRIRSEKPDLLFLDVDMPGLSGLELIQLIDDLPTRVVFTTAHMEYAIKAVETIASGYLLKPVQADDLQKIIARFKSEKELKLLEQPLFGKIAVPDFDGIELVSVESIIYCKSDSNYCELRLTDNRKIIASKTLGYFEGMLPAGQFIRIHKSYMVNIHQIKKYLKRNGGELVMSNNDILPVSRNSKDEILKLIQTSL